MSYDPKDDVNINRRPKHGRILSEAEAAEESRKLKIKVSKANRKKPPVTLPAVKSFNQD